MLYRLGSTTPIEQLLDPTVALIYLLCACTMVAVCIAWTRRGRIGWNDAAFGALVAAFPNTGFMGVPLLVALLGPAAAGPANVTILVDMVLTSSMCIALSRLDPSCSGAAGNGGPIQAAKSALKAVATNPLPWSILAGATVSWLHLRFPMPLVATVGLLADSASPVALFTIGAVLARTRQILPGHSNSISAWVDVWQVALLKLLVHPCLVLVVGTVASAAGAQLQPFALTVIVLVAALPSASNVSMLAERYGADNGRIARIILITTAAAFLSFAVAATLMGPEIKNSATRSASWHSAGFHHS
jgi:predicted permease